MSFSRAREWARGLGVLTSHPHFSDLPQDTVAFIEAYYSCVAPCHNRIHALYGLLWLLNIHAPLQVILAWIGHDAGHTGKASESPEVRSMYLTYEWLAGNAGWCREHRIDPQETAVSIYPTRFPYKRFSLEGKDAGIALLRITDTLRPSSGVTAPHLSHVPVDHFSAYLFEIGRLFDELCPDKMGSMSGFARSFCDEQFSFFTQIRTCCRDRGLMPFDQSTMRVFPHMLTELSRNEQRLRILSGHKHGSSLLESVYELLSGDVTYPEFQRACTTRMRELGITFIE